MSICLRPREFIAGLGSAAAWPLATHAAAAAEADHRLAHHTAPRGTGARCY
jgi:hypothetical protein